MHIPPPPSLPEPLVTTTEAAVCIRVKHNKSAIRILVDAGARPIRLGRQTLWRYNEIAKVLAGESLS